MFDKKTINRMIIFLICIFVLTIPAGCGSVAEEVSLPSDVQENAGETIGSSEPVEATGTTEASEPAEATGTTEAPGPAEAAGTTEASELAEATGTTEAPELAEATGTTEAPETVETSETAQGDPLKGLVANDILVRFREADPVEDSGSVEDEAFALGSWVQKNIGQIPNKIKDKGDKIGRSYEFWFGTDVSNNFDSNFPKIYETYFSLKNYYSSNGERSQDFYERIVKENEFLGSGDLSKIESMYSDMRDFITDCNNIIRNK